MAEVKKYIVYLETDVTVRANSLNEAERIAKEFIKIESYSPLVEIDEHRRQRVVVSERKIEQPNG
jgi:hypothetical protein